MAFQISGRFYKIEWSEEEQKWIGYILPPDPKKRYASDDARIRVWSDEDFERCIAWVLHHLDEEFFFTIEDLKNVQDEQEVAEFSFEGPIECSHQGPRIGSEESRPVCGLGFGHQGPHKPNPSDGWGAIQW